VQSGQAFVSLGTSGVLFAACDGFQPDAKTAVHTFCHALPGMWHQMGVILAATDALNWWAALTGSDAATLTEGLGPLQAPGRTQFLPYLGGERTPLNSASVRARLGMMAATRSTDLATRPPTARTIEPVAALTDTYKEAHARYRAAARHMMELA